MCRLWDLHGKLLQQPVYALLGGMTKKTIPVYATTVRPDLAAKLGFVGCKYPLAYGPDDGDDGFRRNVEIHKHWRERVGPEQPLMIDCCTPSPRALLTLFSCSPALLLACRSSLLLADMGLDVPYSIRLAQALSPLGLKWMEEYLIPVRAQLSFRPCPLPSLQARDRSCRSGSLIPPAE